MFQLPIYSVMYNVITTDIKPLWIPDTAGTALIWCDSSREAKMSFLYVEHNLHITTWIHPVKSAQLYTTLDIRSGHVKEICLWKVFGYPHIDTGTIHHHLVLCHFWRFKREYYTFFTFTSLVDLISGRNSYLSSLFFEKVYFHTL